MTKTKITRAVVAITFDKDRFLILKKKGTWTGWQFVQGAIDENETAETAVLRELKEETGLDGEIVKKLDLKADYWFKWENDLIHKFLVFFLVKADSSKEVKIDVEHSDWKWVSYEEALKEIKFNKDKFKEAYKELKKVVKDEKRLFKTA